MPTMPTDITYGKVVGLLLTGLADGPDGDRLPDPVVPTGLKVKFEMESPIFKTTTPKAQIVAKPITCEIDADGNLVDPQGALGVWLFTGRWKVSYFGAPDFNVPPHTILVTSETEADLTDAQAPGSPLIPTQYEDLNVRVTILEDAPGGGGGGAVDSVNGETGAVVLSAADVGAAPAGQVSALDARLATVETSTGATDASFLQASTFGVSAFEADNSEALEALANTHATLTGAVEITLPTGVIRGYLPMVPGVTWVGHGTTIKHPEAGPTGHLIRPIDPAYLGIRSDDGPLRSGLRNLTVDGQRGLWEISPLPRPAAPVTAPTGGALAAGDYAYVIVPVSVWGRGAASPVAAQSLAALGGITLTWPAIAGATAWQVYGRARWGRSEQRLLATLPGGATSWTDDGSAIPGAGFWLGGDLSAPAGAVIGGAGWTIDDLRIIDSPGMGLYTEWVPTTGRVPDVPWYTNMEAIASRIRVGGANAEGIVWCGPHDSILDNALVSGVSNADGTRDAVHIDSAGPVRCSNVHTWGSHRWSFNMTNPGELVNCQGEGGAAGQVRIYSPDVSILGGEYFYPNGADSVGFMFGDANYSGVVANIVGPRLHGFSSASGPAIDLTRAGDGTVVIAQVEQDTGSVIQGDTAGLSVHIAVRGDANGGLPISTLGGESSPDLWSKDADGNVALGIAPQATAQVAIQATGPLEKHGLSVFTRSGNSGRGFRVVGDEAAGYPELFAVTSTGNAVAKGYLQTGARTATPSAGADASRIYTLLNSTTSKHELYVRFPTGSPILIATEP